jgi:hypothetical protein
VVSLAVARSATRAHGSGKASTAARVLMAYLEVLAQIKAPHFTAGVVLWNDKVVEAAPIIGYMRKAKWSRDKVREYCESKGWKISVVWKMECPGSGLC